jgi:hypothetical protein
MLLVATVLGLWQLRQSLGVFSLFNIWGKLNGGLVPTGLDVTAGLLPAGAGVLALAAGFGRWRVHVAACAAWLLILLAMHMFHIAGLVRLPSGAVVPGAASLGLALLIVWILRWGGLRQMRVREAIAVTLPPAAA